MNIYTHLGDGQWITEDGLKAKLTVFLDPITDDYNFALFIREDAVEEIDENGEAIGWKVHKNPHVERLRGCDSMDSLPPPSYYSEYVNDQRIISRLIPVPRMSSS